MPACLIRGRGRSASLVVILHSKVEACRILFWYPGDGCGHDIKVERESQHTLEVSVMVSTSAIISKMMRLVLLAEEQTEGEK